MKKSLLCVLLTAFLCVAAVAPMAGCGNNKNDGDTQVLRVVAHTGQDSFLEPFFEAFMEENPDIRVEGLYGVDQYQELDTNTPPDLLFIGTGQLADYPQVFEDINVVIDEYYDNDAAKISAFKAQFMDGLLDYCTYQDKLMILPNNVNVGLLYYNKDLFDAAGIAYPDNTWTHDDFIRVGKQLTKKDDNGNYTQWGCSTTGGWWGEYLIYVRQYGGEFYKADGKTPAMDTPEFKQGIEFFKNKCVGENKFAPNPGDTSVGAGALGGFISRATAMEFGGHTGNWVSYNALQGFNWDVEVLPTPVGKPDARGGELALEGWGIAKKSKNKTAAMRLLEYLYTAEGTELYSVSGKLMPTKAFKEKILSTPKAERPVPQNMEAVFEEMERGIPLPANPHFTYCAQAPVWNNIQNYLNGTVSYDGFATASITAINNYVMMQD